MTDTMINTMFNSKTNSKTKSVDIEPAAPVTIRATQPVGPVPSWAVLQRKVFDALEESWPLYWDRYANADGSLPYAGPLQSRDGADDFYEAYVNWPVLYQLGGSDDLLSAAKTGWHGVTRQLTELGYLVDEFERGYDWFHIGESMIFFYALCAADPADTKLADRAHRFASLYLPDSPTGNYDPRHKIITAPHNGAAGPRGGINAEWQPFSSDLAVMRAFGLPLRDVAGIDDWSDLDDPDNAALMGSEMARRLGSGDAAVNLAATSLITNAWLYDGDDRYARWVQDYVDGWHARARANDGLIPDNVGTDGRVGANHHGRWWGGSYGWAWPHGLYSVGPATCIAGLNTLLATGDPDTLDLPADTLDHVYRHGFVGSVSRTPMSIRDRWQAELGDDIDRPVFLVPNRFAERGWFDFQPAQLGLPTWLAQAGGRARDIERLDWLRRYSGYDWRPVRDFRNKEDAGHEAPWLAYLAGENPDYPELILQVALSQIQRRTELIMSDDDGTPVNVHHWQRHNPVTTEALLQLTTGTPQLLYTGGLLPTRLQHHDLDRDRPGLPPDVAVLVDRVDTDRIALQVINTAATRTRRLGIRSGNFGADRIDAVSWSESLPDHDNPVAYTRPDPVVVNRRMEVETDRLAIELPPGRRIRLELDLTPRTYRAGYRTASDT